MSETITEPSYGSVVIPYYGSLIMYTWKLLCNYSRY